MLIVGACVVYCALSVPTEAELIDRYRRSATEAQRAEDGRLGLLALERLVDLEGPGVGTVFAMAVAHDHLGNEAIVDELLSVLAPVDRPGFPPAHFLRAERMLLTWARQVAERRHTSAIVHLERAIRAGFRSGEARSRLCWVYAASGDFSRAAALASQLATTPDANPSLLCRALEMLDRMAPSVADRRQLARSATAVRRGQSARRLGLDLTVLMRLSGQTREALDMLALARQQEPGNQRILRLITSTCLTAGLAASDLTERARHIVAGWQASPLDVAFLEHALRESEPVRRALMAAVEVRLEECTETQARLIRGAIGSAFCGNGQYDEAISHLEVAVEGFPDNAALLNNLALALASQRKPDLTRARVLIDRARTLANNSPPIEETYGQILLKSGQAASALEVFDEVLPFLSRKSATLSAIAACYSQLGNSALAERFRRKAREVGEVEERLAEVARSPLG